MLRGIGLRNFKAFGDEMQEAPLSKITLIYGPNSGGKSSIIQALLLLKQSLKNDYTISTRTLVARGELVNLGSPHAMLHKHDESREFGINVKYENLNLGDGSAENDLSMTYSSIGKLSSVTYKITSAESSGILLHANATENYDFPFPLSAWNAKVRILDLNGNKVVYFIRNFLPLLAFPELTEVREEAQNQAPSTESERMVTVSGPTLERTLEAMDIDDLQALAAIAARASRQILAQKKAWRQALALSLEVQVQKQTLANDLQLDRGLALKWEQERVWELEEELEQTEERIAELNERIVDIEELYEREAILETRAREIEKELERVKERAWETGLQQLEGADELEKELSEQKLSPQQILDLMPENIPADYERYLHSVNYLAPVRSAPERLYWLSTENVSSSGITGIQGEYSANVLARDYDGIETEVNRWFRQFEIPYDIHARNWGEASVGEVITIELMPLDKEGDILDGNFTVTLADVGYGINQILPVIIEGIASQEGAILCVEQPEIHLHPRLQANIADLMIDTIADEPGKRKQWIVETHSELLILRLQRRIREGKIKPEDISVLYVDPNDESTEGSAIKVLRLGEDSYFKDPWPDGFFDDGLKERLPDDNEFESSDDDTNILDKLFSE